MPALPHQSESGAYRKHAPNVDVEHAEEDLPTHITLYARRLYGLKITRTNPFWEGFKGKDHVQLSGCRLWPRGRCQ